MILIITSVMKAIYDLKLKMKVYRYSSKIKKSETAGERFVDCRSGLRLEQMKLSVGICVLVIASLLQCIGGTGTFTLLSHEK